MAKEAKRREAVMYWFCAIIGAVAGLFIARLMTLYDFSAELYRQAGVSDCRIDNLEQRVWGAQRTEAECKDGKVTE